MLVLVLFRYFVFWTCLFDCVCILEISTVLVWMPAYETLLPYYQQALQTNHEPPPSPLNIHYSQSGCKFTGPGPGPGPCMLHVHGCKMFTTTNFWFSSHWLIEHCFNL